MLRKLILNLSCMNKLKQHLLLMLLSLCSMASYAYDFEVDGLYYNLLSASEKTVLFAGYANGETQENLDIPVTVSSRGVQFSVVGIADNSNISVRNAILPEHIKQLGEHSFAKVGTLRFNSTVSKLPAYFCEQADSIFVAGNVTSLGIMSLGDVGYLYFEYSDTPCNTSNHIANAKTLILNRDISTKIWLGNSFGTGIRTLSYGTASNETGPTVMHDYLLAGLSSLERLIIRPSIKSIGGDVGLQSCKNLSSLVIEESPSILSMGSYYHVEYKNYHYHYIYDNLFINCRLNEIYLGRSLFIPSYRKESIKSGSGVDATFTDYDLTSPFYKYGTPLRKVTIADNVKVSPYLFYESYYLEEPSIGNGVEICENAFLDCRALKSIKLPTSFTLHGNAFANCQVAKLDNLSDKFDNVVIDGDPFTGCDYIRNNLKSLKLNAESIQLKDAFCNYDKLQVLEIVCNSGTIGEGAFKNNGRLQHVSMSGNIQSIGNNAFLNCTSLTEIGCDMPMPPKCLKSPFEGVNKWNATLYVPKEAKEKYSVADGWKDFLFVEEMPMPEFVVSTTNAPSDSNPQNHILKQPNCEEPIVELANADNKATYQWYRVSTETIPANTPIDFMGEVQSLGEYPWVNIGSGIESSNIGKHNSSSCAELLFDFKTGDKLSFDWSVNGEQYFDNLQILENGENIVLKNGAQTGHYENTFEKEQEGTYQFRYVKDESVSEGYDKASITNISFVSPEKRDIKKISAIEGENTNCLQSSKLPYGDKVFCIVTLGNGYKLKSNEFVLEYLNFIKTQPTPENLFVELDAPEEGATYQWYQGIETKTDSKDIVPSSSGSYNWTESNGVWTSGNKNVSSSSSIMTATIDVEAGDVISFDWNVSSEAGYDYFYCIINGTQVLKKSGTDNGTYTQEFSATSKVTIEYKYTKDSGVNSGIDCATVSNIKLIRPSGFSNVVESEITSANTSILDEMLIEGDATVWCVVTLPNGRILVSDKVQYNYNYALHFKKTHSEILSKTTATVSISDLEAIESALSEYANLPEDAQMKLLEEKALLDALKAKLDELMIPSDMYCLVLEKKDGSLEKYFLSDRPEISLSNNTVIVSSEKVQTDCPIVDFVRFYFEENKADEISVNTASSFAFKYNENMVYISGADNAEVYSADGMKLMEQYATNGEIRMNISSLVSGLYIIKTDKKSIKIRK